MSDYDRPLSRAQQRDLERSEQIKTNVMERAKRFNTGKPRPHLVPVEWIEQLMEVMEIGAEKYGENNWQKGMPFVEVLDSLERHLIQFKKKIDIDPDDGARVLAKIAVNALFLLTYQLKGLEEYDDR